MLLHNEKLLNIFENAEKYCEFYEYIDIILEEMNNNKMGDKYHLIFECNHNLVSEYRIKYLPKY